MHQPGCATAGEAVVGHSRCSFASLTSRDATGGTVYGMVKTTLYLPDDLKADLTREAIRRGDSEAEVIREALRRELRAVRPRPRGAIISGREPIAERVDELLEGFGAA